MSNKEDNKMLSEAMGSLEQEIGRMQGKLDIIPALREEIAGLRQDLKDIYKKIDRTCTDCPPSVEVRNLRKDYEDHITEHRNGKNLEWSFIIGLTIAVFALIAGRFIK